jgi:YD repeat-containing protein
LERVSALAIQAADLKPLTSIALFERRKSSHQLDETGSTRKPVISYTYDNLYRLLRADYLSDDGAIDGSYFAYTYDAVGNRLSEVECWGGTSCTPITTTYGYDAANRLTSVGTQAYTWDDNGNLLADGVFTYTYDAANRLITATTGVTTTGFAYNGLGDRTHQSIGGVVTTYTLDLEAGLTQVLADGTFTYLYGNGRIAQATITETLSTPVEKVHRSSG